MQSCVVDQLLGESAAAAVTFAMAISNSMDDNENPAVYSSFTEKIHTILQSFYPSIFPYFLECVDCHHKHFLWTGPDLQIIPHLDSIMPLLTMGKLLDLPGHPIYAGTTTTEMPSPIPMAICHPPTEKCHLPGDVSDIDQPKKCRQ